MIFPRWRVIHANGGDMQAQAQKNHAVRIRVGSIVDTTIPLMVASYTLFVESGRVVLVLNKGVCFTGTEWQEVRAAVRERYKTGHYIRKPHKKPRQPGGRPWGRGYLPDPQPAPRTTRMA